MSHHPVIVMDELFQSCSIRNNSLFTKTTKTETRRSKMGPHMSGEKERETRRQLGLDFLFVFRG